MLIGRARCLPNPEAAPYGRRSRPYGSGFGRRSRPYGAAWSRPRQLSPNGAPID